MSTLALPPQNTVPIQPATLSPALHAGSQATGEARLHFGFLDGIRGLAALYVVVTHARLDVDWTQVHSGVRSVLPFISHGTISVAVFIVLSGFCLMLPVARKGGDRLRDGLSLYIRRRAWRILPPYYAALLLSLGLLTVLSPAQLAVCHWLNSMTPVTGAGTLVSHVFLAHNLHNDWIFRVNAPFWSVATEWQIYFLFPLLLLPIYRTTGVLPAVVVSFTVGLLPIVVFRRFETAAPWFLGLFALGMVAAAVAVSPLHARWRSRGTTPWAVASFCFALLAVAVAWGGAYTPLADSWKLAFLFQSTAGVAASCFLVWCTIWATRGTGTPAVVRFFGSRSLVFLGTFSYSLYLTHAWPVGLTPLVIEPLGLGPTAHAVVSILFASLASLPVAYLFFLAFERPVLYRRGKSHNAAYGRGT